MFPSRSGLSSSSGRTCLTCLTARITPKALVQSVFPAGRLRALASAPQSWPMARADETIGQVGGIDRRRLQRGDRPGARCTCLLPFGILEKHGPHLPLGTDLLNARYVAEYAAQEE